MKKIFKPNLCPLFTLTAGAIGFGLRLWLFLGGTDSKGLLVKGHPAGIVCFVLTAITLAVIALCCRTLPPLGNYRKLFPASLIAGIGCFVAAAGILYVDIRDIMSQRDTITLITMVMGVLAAASLVVIGLFRMKGKRPFFPLHSIVTVYFMLHLVSQYRLWSSQPQLQVYFFPLLASVFLMLTTYYYTVLDTEKKGKRQAFLFCNQSAVFFCLLSLQEAAWPFYLTMGLWLTTNLCSLKNLPAPEKEEG